MAKILVVDDDIDSVEVLAEYLKIKGHHILGIAYNGKHALEQYKKLKPEIVLMDLEMIDYNGYWGLEKIREYDPVAKLIMVTGAVTPSDAELLQKHAAAIILKPIEMKELLKTIDRVMNTPKKEVAIGKR